MYICVTCMGGMKAGDAVIVEKDNELRELAVRPIGGVVAGYVTYTQPEGCVDYRYAYDNIGERRIIGRIAVVSGSVALVESDSDALTQDLCRGYGQNIFASVA